MELSMMITNYNVYSIVQTKLSSLASQITLLNQPLQYLYDHKMADEILVDDESEIQDNTVINTNFSNEDDNYLPNPYCPSFTVMLNVFQTKNQRTNWKDEINKSIIGQVDPSIFITIKWHAFDLWQLELCD